MKPYLTGVSDGYLRVMTCKARKINKLFGYEYDPKTLKRIDGIPGYMVNQVTYSVDSISRLTNSQIEYIIEQVKSKTITSSVNEISEPVVNASANDPADDNFSDASEDDFEKTIREAFEEHDATIEKERQNKTSSNVVTPAKGLRSNRANDYDDLLIPKKPQMSIIEMKKFEGWEMALDPDTFSLLSILNFRKTKLDFTCNKRVEHSMIFKFVIWIAEGTTDKKWKKATSVLNERLQAQGEDVKSFWRSVETEKIEAEKRLLEMKVELAETQFSVDRTLTGNEAHRIFDRKKLNYALNSNITEKSIGKRLADDDGTEDARSYKYQRGQGYKEPSTPEDNISAHDDKSDNESIMSDSPIHNEFAREMKMADEANEYYSDPESTESTESVNDDDDDYVYSSESSSCDVVEKTKIEFTEFEKTYLKMNDSDKWKLSTGKIVEDALYNFGIKCRHEHLCHSFVIDPNDNIYINEEVFTEAELDEIRKYKLIPMPQMPQDLLTYLNSFRVSDISSLRDAIFKSQQWDSPYNRQTHFDYDWIRNTAYNLLHEYEAGSLEKDHLELWLLVHVWNFVDRGFGNIDGLETARSESSSRASSNRKNRNRTGSAIVKMKRKIMGRRGDLIIRKVSTEYGCSEAGKSFEAVGNEEEKIRKLQSIGFIHSGLMILLLRIDSPVGYTCRITRTKMLEVPSQIAQFGSKVLPVIMLAWKAKMIVKETIEFVEQKQYSKNEEDTDDQLQNLQNSCEFSPPRKKINQVVAFDSPSSKSKTKKGITLNSNNKPERNSKK
ncbi:17468_t:CDS:10 [Funneliformis geosporum]|nr:17468_t:CDS:10 [Funneliformis geosporum]